MASWYWWFESVSYHRETVVSGVFEFELIRVDTGDSESIGNWFGKYNSCLILLDEQIKLNEMILTIEGYLTYTYFYTYSYSRDTV